MGLPQVVVKARRTGPARRGHPWLFERAIHQINGVPAPGNAVAVHAEDGTFLAHGLFNPHSLIRVRLYSWQADQPVDEGLIVSRLEEAIQFRTSIPEYAEPSGACRLVASEGDRLSGLFIDRYADVIVVQFNSLAMSRFESVILETLQKHFSPRAIIRRADPAISRLEHLDLSETVLVGDAPATVDYVESGVTFRISPLEGQKTGGYLDQRENRRAAARYAAGRTVLDVFSNTGGFGLVACMLGKAAGWTAVDSSAPTLELLRQNAQNNNVAVEVVQQDAGAAMTRMIRENKRFGMVVLDPPKFASKIGDLDGALRGYEFINRQAIQLVEPGGILVTCSCSGHVTPEIFRDVLAVSGTKEACELTILEERGHAADHPVSIACPESAYLKCVIARVRKR